MRRLALYIGSGLLALVLMCLFGGYWLVDTTAGARFALGALSAAAGFDLSVQRVEGRLLDRLQLTGVRLSQPKLAARIDSLVLAWEPRGAFYGNLVVHELSAAGVRVQDDRPATAEPPKLRWPQLSGVARRVSAEISRLRLTGLSYRHLAAPPLLVTELSASAAFKGGLLSVSDLVLVSPDGRASGEIAAGFWHPSLRLDLAVAPARPVRELDFFSLQARLLPARDPERLAGPVAVAGRGAGAQRLELTTELGIGENSLNLRRLKLSWPGRRGVLTGTLGIKLAHPEPLFSAALRATDLDLAQELQLPTRLSGTLNFSGSLSKFLGNFALTNSGPGWQAASLAADYRGGNAGVKLEPLTGTLLDGRLSGALEVAWSRGLRVVGNLAGRGLNPGMLDPRWSGRVNLDLAGRLDKPEQGALKGELRGKLLQSRLHGQDLQGELLAAFAGERLRIDRLLLRGRGFHLQGAGELDRRLNLAAAVSDLSGLVPGAAGELRADGWLRWRDGVLSGAASGQGHNVAAAGVSAKALRLDARLGEGEGRGKGAYPVYLDASLSRLRVGRFQAQRALLTLQGTAARHTLKAQLVSPGGGTPAPGTAPAELRLALAGGYGDGVWQGELTGLSGRDAVGPWNLAAPAPLLLSAQRVRLAPLVINGLAGERVEVAGELNRQPRSGTLRGSWGGLNLARANAWLTGVELAGGSSGALTVRLLPGERLVIAGRAEAKGSMVADGQRIDLERLAATLDGDRDGVRAALELSLKDGAGAAHLSFDSPDPAALALPGRGDLALQWSNLDLALLRPATPSGVVLVGRSAGRVRGKLLPGGRLDLKGDAALDNGHLNWRAQGDEFDASVDTANLEFSWRGAAWAPGDAGNLLRLTVRAAAHGSYTTRGERIAFGRLTLRADADQKGTRAGLDLALEKGGTLRLAVSSDSPAGLRIPETGDLALQWGGIDPALAKPWLPGALDLKGELAGQASGRLLPGRRLELTGQAEFSQGRAKWQGETGELNANLRSATLSWVWRGETLTGALALALSEYGKAQGDFLLPIPARLPVRPDRNGALRGALAGRVQERGFLNVLLPGLVQESHGDLDLDVKLSGIWSDPRVSGILQLSKAGAYLPSAGIRLSEVQLGARLEGDQLRIDNFRAVSGKGHIEGNLQARLSGWQLAEYSGTLSGDNFQTVYLPELTMVTSPQLSFEGSAQKVTLRGEVRIPEMLVSGPPVAQIVTPSGDVILEGAPPASREKPFPLVLDGRVRVVLGDKVEVKASGIDARLGGSMYLVLQGLDSISSSGEIQVVKGRYRAYGLDLEIVRGRLYYVDDPVSRPTLDILALRKVGDVSAGVIVAGSLKAPVVKLYSEPSMPEVDIVAYMVLGHPLGASSEQGSMVATAASSLFSLGGSSSVQEQIKDRLGLNVLGIETVDTAGAGRMGYKEIPVTPTGGARAKGTAGESLMTVGKYLTPEIYLSYGRSLVTGGNLFTLRYDISRRFQLETQSGSESGIDLYYKLEFN